MDGIKRNKKKEKILTTEHTDHTDKIVRKIRGYQRRQGKVKVKRAGVGWVVSTLTCLSSLRPLRLCGEISEGK